MLICSKDVIWSTDPSNFANGAQWLKHKQFAYFLHFWAPLNAYFQMIKARCHEVVVIASYPSWFFCYTPGHNITNHPREAYFCVNSTRIETKRLKELISKGNIFQISIITAPCLNLPLSPKEGEFRNRPIRQLFLSGQHKVRRKFYDK